VTLSASLKSSVSGNSVIRKRQGSGGRFERVRANGSDIFLGAMVTRKGETADDPDVDLAATGERVAGVIVGPAPPNVLDLDKDSDDCYADDTYLLMYVPVPGDQLYLTAATNTACTYGELQVNSGGFIGGDFSYANSAVATDSLIDVVGYSLETISAATGVEKIVLIEWGK
jgi:hypothetical protein